MKRVNLQLITPNSEQSGITLSNINPGIGKLIDYAGIFLNAEYGPQHKKNCLRGFANNKGADQPAHPRSLISAFVIRLFESNICKIATSKLSIF